MCKGVSYDKNLYGNKNLVSYLNTPELITNEFSATDDELVKYLLSMLGKSSTDIPFLSPFLMSWIQSRLLGSSNLSDYVRGSFKTTLNSNTYNFSVAKSYQFLDGLKLLANSISDNEELIAKQKQYTNLVFSAQQSVEEYQMTHMTDLINTVDGRNSELLEYVSERDTRVRPTHKAQDGTIRDKQDPYWTQAITLLSEWNCRCSIEKAPPNAKMTATYLVATSESKYNAPSEVDFQKGNAIIYSQNLPVFQNAPVIIRQKFKKDGF